MRMLILDAETATAVAGSTADGAALEPIPLADGTFALPARVLADPAHAERHAQLCGLPTREAAECAWLEEE